MLVRLWTTGSSYPVGRIVNSFTLKSCLVILLMLKTCNPISQQFHSWVQTQQIRVQMSTRRRVLEGSLQHCSKQAQAGNYWNAHQSLNGFHSVVVYSPNGTQLSRESEQTSVTHNNRMDESHAGKRSQTRRSTYSTTPSITAFVKGTKRGKPHP